jgi:signal transduction histidine kinase
VVVELTAAQRRLAEIQEAERLHLARELHDITVQQLLSISYQLNAIRQITGMGEHRDTLRDVGLAEALDDIYAEVLGVVKQLRGVTGELRPAGLQELGLTTALEGYVARLQRERSAELPDITLDLDQSSISLSQSIAYCLFRAAQEALRNALLHAHADHILLCLRLLPAEAVLSVRDDGQGFQMPARLSELAQANHFGLVGIAERVALVDGQLTLQSQPGMGTEVKVKIPLSEKEINNGRDNSSIAG